jgi:hypothetical protein
MFKKVIEEEIDLPSAGDGEGISVMSNEKKISIFHWPQLASNKQLF